jgi:16S rRNA (guanine1516-N2)-methyltransferase
MSQTQTITTPSVGIFYTQPDQKERAEQLAGSLGLPVITETTGYDFILSYSHDRLSLSMPKDSRQRGQVYAEFVQGAAGYRRKHGSKEMLLRAIGFHKNKRLTILDVTGGMGRDSFLLAGYGCNVHTLERNRIVSALLEDGLLRASEHPDTRDIVGRIQLSIRDSLVFLLDAIGTEKKYDVIYLDPMYPERSKSALVKKEMQMLQKLVGCENDTVQLFTAALAVARKRVVIKRPKTAPPLADSTPSHSLSGKTTRFDVYMIPDSPTDKK